MKRIHIIIAILITWVVGAFSASAQEEFKRGLEQISFVPKGQWIAGVSVSYSQSNQNNYQFLVIENLNGDTYSFKVSPMAMYCFKDNLAAGGRFAYSRSKTNLKNADIVLGADTGYNLDNLYSLGQNWHYIGAFRNYISLGRNRRFGLFNEIQLEVSHGESKLCSGSGEQLTGTFSRDFGLNIGLAPGLIMFLNNYSAIEVNIGVLGFSYNKTKATTDQIYVANMNTKSANFKINLFSVSFGVVFYL